MPPVLNIAAYKFVRIDDPLALREHLRERATAHALKGTILIAPEGINLVLAGAIASLEAFWAELSADPRFADSVAKRSRSARVPFRRLLVKVKREIITLRAEGIDPERDPAPRIAPAALKALLDAQAPVVLLDTRNRFEVEAGTFRGALDLGLRSFTELRTKIEALPEALRTATVVTFCTGGIRCEKAAPLLAARGFKRVLQLDGGILGYFERCGGAHFDGACLVFDERVALDSSLAPAGAPVQTTTV